ncbi:MAG: tryptophan synthase subunit alpha [Deltaproteobacteria bacterium]|jgi:tryptophan synthase alpha chain|nr:tryptophan synthase subunit alpha [Deltaproteobacteria bacterium]
MSEKKSAAKSRLTESILKAREEKRFARIPYLTAGFPDPERFWESLSQLDENGADVIEIGAPFSDPVADGPVIAAASQEALKNGVSLKWILDGLKTRSFKSPLVVMSYANPLLQFAWEEAGGSSLPEKTFSSLKILGEALKEAGILGVIVPDLPLEESAPFREALELSEVDLVILVGPNTTRFRMEEYRSVARGYVYVVSVLGTTGVRQGLPPEVEDTLKRAREVFSLPLALGFGIKEPGQLKGLSTSPDAVVFGSALVRHLKEGGGAGEFMKPWLGEGGAL